MYLAMSTAPSDVRERLVRMGRDVKEFVLEDLPTDVAHVPQRVRTLYEEYSNSRGVVRDFDDYTSELGHTYNVERFIVYVMTYAALMNAVSNLNVGKLRAALREAYSLSPDFFADPGTGRERLVGAFSEAYGEERERIEKPLRIFVRGLRRILTLRRKPLYLWLAGYRKMEALERDLLDALFPRASSERRLRAVRTLVRVFTHPTNAPIAIRIAANRTERNKYVPVADYYSVLVTIRSGAFEDVKSGTRDRLVGRANARSEGETIRVRLSSVKGLARQVAKVSGDPVLYERGAFHIGYMYCHVPLCDKCPLNDVCGRYVFFEVK